MSRKTRPFSELKAERLRNPEVAAHYLNTTLLQSPENFLPALRNVAQAHRLVHVAKQSGVQRETLHRSLSSEGNPTLETLLSVLRAVGLRFTVASQHPEAAQQSATGSADSGEKAAAPMQSMGDTQIGLVGVSGRKRPDLMLIDRPIYRARSYSAYESAAGGQRWNN